MEAKMDKVDKDKIIYPKLSYTIQGCFFELYNTLRYLDLSEEAWEKALVIVLSGTRACCRAPSQT